MINMSSSCLVVFFLSETRRRASRSLEAIKMYRVYSLSLIASRTGYAKSTVSQYLRRLVDMGYIDEIVLYDIVRKRVCKYFAPKDQSQSALHRILVSMVKSYLDSVKIPSAVFNTKDKPDIEALVGGRRIAIEIETGLKHDFTKTREMVLERLAEYDEVLIVTPNSVVRKRYEEELGRIAEENDYRLKIVEYRELPELLKPVANIHRPR